MDLAGSSGWNHCFLVSGLRKCIYFTPYVTILSINIPATWLLRNWRPNLHSTTTFRWVNSLVTVIERNYKSNFVLNTFWSHSKGAQLSPALKAKAKSRNIKSHLPVMRSSWFLRTRSVLYRIFMSAIIYFYYSKYRQILCDFAAF